MADVLTFGLAEVLLPFALYHYLIVEPNTVHRYRVWYDSNGKVFHVHEYHHPAVQHVIENGTNSRHEYDWVDPPAPPGEDPRWVY